MVSLSHHLPSGLKTLEPIALGEWEKMMQVVGYGMGLKIDKDYVGCCRLIIGASPNITSAVVQSSQSVSITWSRDSGVERYVIGFERVIGSQQLQCPQFHHNSTQSVSPATEYTLTGLEEFSVYTISLTAVSFDGIQSLPARVQITTWPAGEEEMMSFVFLSEQQW